LIRGLAIGALVLAAAPSPSLGCDSTSCLLVTRGAAGVLGRGIFQIDASFRYTDQSARRNATRPGGSVLRPKAFLESGLLVPGHHEDLTGSEDSLQLDVAWGAAARTTVFASVPLLNRKYYEVGHGGFVTGYNTRGLGDLVLGARQALFRTPQRSLLMSLGVKLPTGRNDVIDD